MKRPHTREITILFFALYFLLFACTEQESENEVKWQNKFSDEVIRQIYNLKDARNTSGLLPYLSHNNAKYRKEAALAFGSVQDSLAINLLSQLISDSVKDVRIAAAFAIGQTRNKLALNELEKSIRNESNDEVKEALLKAYGKCVVLPTDLAVLYDFLKEQSCCKEGAIWGLYYAGIKNVFPETEEEKKLIYLLSEEKDNGIKLAIASYFSRFSNRVFEDFQTPLLIAAKQNKEIYVKNGLIKSLINVQGEELIQFYESILKDSLSDYRWKISALHAASKHPYQSVKELYWNALDDKQEAVVIRASEYLKENVPKSDLRRLINASKSQSNIRAKSDLLARCKMLDSLKEVDDYIFEVFNQINDQYDVANMVKSEASGRFALDFLQNLINQDTTAIIRTTAFDSYLKLLENTAYVSMLQQDETLRNNYIASFKASMLSGDIAINYLGANALRNEKIPLKSWISDYSFLQDCLQKLSLPIDVEAWLAIQNTLKSISDTAYHIPPIPMGENPINWSSIEEVSSNKKLNFKTNKGTFTIELFTEEAPGTVATFMQLVRNGFYEGKNIHRHVPDFVVQGGCPRGDGFGGLPETIRSEFGLREYNQEGLLGIASAGKDTESCQFFITHSPTPHLNGRYTIFAQVTDGMEVIHQLAMGDTIDSISDFNK